MQDDPMTVRSPLLKREIRQPDVSATLRAYAAGLDGWLKRHGRVFATPLSGAPIYPPPLAICSSVT